MFAKPEYVWDIMLEDGHIFHGEGSEKMLIQAMTVPGVIDGDVWYDNHRYNLDFWKFLIR